MGGEEVQVKLRLSVGECRRQFVRGWMSLRSTTMTTALWVWLKSVMI